MATTPHSELSRRERQIMDVIHKRGRASAADVMEDLPDGPGYSAVRTFLGILERKGHLKHVQEGARYIYSPTAPTRQAGQNALKRVLHTFYGGSLEKAMAALLSASEARVSEQDLQRLRKLIDQSRKEGR